MKRTTARPTSLIRSFGMRAILAVALSLVLAWGSVTVASTIGQTKLPNASDGISLAKKSKLTPAEREEREESRRGERLRRKAEKKCRKLERKHPEAEESSFTVTVGYPPRTFNCDEL